MGEGGARLRVEAAYAAPGRQVVHALEVPAGTTVEEVIRRSGLLAEFPEIDLGRHRVGIFGAAVDLKSEVVDGDRVEIYRPLLIDPKEARRGRVKPRRGKRA